MLKLKLKSRRRDVTTINTNNDTQISRKEIIERLTLKREVIFIDMNRIRKHNDNLRMRLKVYITKRNKEKYCLEYRIKEIIHVFNITGRCTAVV